MNNTPATVQGMRIVHRPDMITWGPAFPEPRSWKERLFSLPWQPWRATRMVRASQPSQRIITHPRHNVMYMHPSTARLLERRLAEQEAKHRDNTHLTTESQ